MALRRAHQAAIAAASDGSVLINVAGLLPEDVQARLSRRLGAKTIFVGIPLSEADALEVVSRLDGAAAEASAHLLGGRSTRPTTERSRARKAPAKRAAKRR